MKNLQLVLGIDKDNPLFSIYSPEDNPEMLEVYFGLALLERVERGKDPFQFKLLVGRLYNMKYRRKALVDAFGFDLKTIRKWGNALKSGQIGMIEAAFAGHEIRRKMTPEIESYARSRFRDIYQDFIHTSSGEPVFFKSFDNYYDLSERFPTTVAEFAQTLENPLRNLVFVIDRGIYSHDTLSEIHRRGDTIVTWEKGYGHDGWDDKLPRPPFQDHTLPQQPGGHHKLRIRLRQVSIRQDIGLRQDHRQGPARREGGYRGVRPCERRRTYNGGGGDGHQQLQK